MDNSTLKITILVLLALIVIVLAVFISKGFFKNKNNWGNKDLKKEDLLGDTFEFVDYGSHYLITKYKGRNKVVEIPKQYKNKPVWGLVTPFLKSNVEKVTFEKGFIFKNTYLGFMQNTKIVDVTLPSTITKIRNYTKVASAMETLEIPPSVIEIGKLAFAGDNKTSLLREVYLNEGLITIGQGAFGYNPNLKSIRIPKSVKSFNLDSSYPFGTEFQFKKGTDVSKYEAKYPMMEYTFTFYE